MRQDKLKMQRISRRNYFLIFFLFLFFAGILFLYIKNITHDVYAGDVGDIATAAYFFGVPHPPGYPTLTLLGFIFSKTPIPLPIISRIALVSVVVSIGGLIIYFKFILENCRPRPGLLLKGEGNRMRIENLAVGVLSTGILGFSYYYWLYAEVPEVFALNNFFVIATYYSSYLFYKNKKSIYLYLTSFIVGLSMTNQQAIMFSFPGLFVMVLPDMWGLLIGTKLRLKKGFIPKLTQIISQFIRNFYIFRNVLFAFILGLMPYVYVFISASRNPQINWMKEPTIYNFIRLILRMDYKFAENLVGFTQRFVVQGIYFSTLIDTYSMVLFLIGLIGILFLFFHHKRIFASLLTGFLFAGPIFIFIITPEIIDQDEFGVMERMYMQSFVIFSFFIPFGLTAILELFYKIIPKRIYSMVFLIPFMIVLLQMIYYNNPKTDLSKTKIGSNYAKDVLEPLPRNSIVYLLGDTGTLNTWYVRYVEGFRPDIDFAGSFGDRNDFEKKIYGDYLEKNKDTKLSMEDVVVSKFPEIMKRRKIYSMYQFPVGKNYMWVPKGLVFELMSVSEIPDKDSYLREVNEITRGYHIAYREKLLSSEQNNIAPSISRHYSNAFNHIGDILYVRYNDLSSAFSYYSRAQIIDPENSLSYAKLGIIQAEFPAQCNLAIENIDTSIEMYKIYRPYYTFALRIYNKCKAEEEKINDLKIRYKNIFLKDLAKDPHY